MTQVHNPYVYGWLCREVHLVLSQVMKFARYANSETRQPLV